MSEKEAAESARPTLEALLENADLCFITAGMGGGTGTGSAPVVGARSPRNRVLSLSVWSTTPSRLRKPG